MYDRRCADTGRAVLVVTSRPDKKVILVEVEITGFDDLVETGSIAEARAKGKAPTKARIL